MKKEINMFYFFQDMDSVVYEMLYEVGVVRGKDWDKVSYVGGKEKATFFRDGKEVYSGFPVKATREQMKDRVMSDIEATIERFFSKLEVEYKRIKKEREQFKQLLPKGYYK